VRVFHHFSDRGCRDRALRRSSPYGLMQKIDAHPEQKGK